MQPLRRAGRELQARGDGSTRPRLRGAVEQNPRLVYCSIAATARPAPTGCGPDTTSTTSLAPGCWASGGLPAGGRRCPRDKWPTSAEGASSQLAGILAALHERARTGLGRFVDVSMTDGATAFFHLQLAARLVMGEEGEPLERGEGSAQRRFPLLRAVPDQGRAVARRRGARAQVFRRAVRRAGAPRAVGRRLRHRRGRASDPGGARGALLRADPAGMGRLSSVSATCASSPFSRATRSSKTPSFAPAGCSRSWAGWYGSDSAAAGARLP